MDEPTSAAKRLQQHYEDSMFVDPYRGPVFSEANKHEDIRELYRFVLARNAERALDAEPITPERLEAMGATRRITDKLHLALRDETAVHGGWRVGFKCPVDDYQTNTAWIPLWLRTMGDVRKLLIGLGYSVTKETA